LQQQQQLTALDSTLVISDQRLEDLAKESFSIGKASKLEVLNTQVDLNTDKVNLLRQQGCIPILKRP
jgi:outer membrane protein TolC